MGIFGDGAKAYRDQGLSVLPCEQGEKRPAKELKWAGYCNNLPWSKSRSGWLLAYAEPNIGLALGAEVVPEHQLAAIDVDRDDLVRVP